MSLILNIETATEVCSVCLSQGTEVLALRETSEAYQHAAQLTLLIESCLEEAQHRLSDLDAVAVSQGPGSYTALRVGTSTAKGICYALQKPLLAIDTLQALAYASREESDQEALYVPMIDARRMEVYTAVFDAEGQRVQATEARVIEATSYDAYWQQNQALVFAGNGAAKCREVLQNPLAQFRDVPHSARHLVPWSVRAFAAQQWADLAYYAPQYFKSPNITKPKKIWGN